MTQRLTEFGALGATSCMTVTGCAFWNTPERRPVLAPVARWACGRWITFTDWEMTASRLQWRRGLHPVLRYGRAPRPRRRGSGSCTATLQATTCTIGALASGGWHSVFRDVLALSSEMLSEQSEVLALGDAVRVFLQYGLPQYPYLIQQY